MRWDHDFPTGLAGLDAAQDVLGENGKAGVVVILDRVDEMVFVEVGVEMLKVRSHAEVVAGDDRAGVRVLEGVDVKLERVFE